MITLVVMQSSIMMRFCCNDVLNLPNQLVYLCLVLWDVIIIRCIKVTTCTMHLCKLVSNKCFQMIFNYQESSEKLSFQLFIKSVEGINLC